MKKNPHIGKDVHTPHHAPSRQKKLRTLFDKAALILFSVVLFFTALEISLWAFSAVSLIMRHNSMNIPARGDNGSFRIMCIGESTTAMGGPYSYPAQLEQVLNASSTNMSFTVINNGLIASNSSNIAAKLENDIERYHPDMILAMIGINDLDPTSSFEAEHTTRPVWRRLKSFRLISAVIQSLIDKIRNSSVLEQAYRAQPARHTANGTPADNIETSLTAGWRARQDHQYTKAKKHFATAISLDPSDVRAYFALGWLLQDEGENIEAEKLFMEAIKRNPGQAGAYVGMGWFLQTPARAREAENAFKNIIAGNGNVYDACVGLGWLFKFQGRNADAEAAFNKALAIDPGNRRAYVGLAEIYRSQGKIIEAENLLKNTETLRIEKNSGQEPGYPTDTYLELGWLYKNTGKRPQAREAFHRAIAASPPKGKVAEKAYGGLFIMDIEDGINSGEASSSLSLQRSGLNPVTRDNYREIKRIAEENGIKLVCMQYPLRSIITLEQGLGTEEGIIFVENVTNFVEIIHSNGYNSCFWDAFGGDFGHCTRLGNRLIAENAAKAILGSLKK